MQEKIVQNYLQQANNGDIRPEKPKNRDGSASKNSIHNNWQHSEVAALAEHHQPDPKSVSVPVFVDEDHREVKNDLGED